MQNNFRQRLARRVRASRFLLPMLGLGAALAACVSSATPAPTAVVTVTPLAFVTRVTETSVTSHAPTPTPRAENTLAPHAPTDAPQPTRVDSPPPPAPADLAPGVVVYETTVTFNAYPYEKFQRARTDPATNVTFQAFDRAAYDAAAPTLTKQPKTFRALVLANEYLHLTILPELGGRIFQITHKQTGLDFLYNNRVLKPTPWGMPEQGGWLAAGGIEWAFPTREHGYEWNAGWDAQTERTAQGVSVILRDTRARDRPRAEVRVTLPPRAAYVIVAPRVENPTAQPQRLQFWTNMLLNLGAPHALAPQTRFLFPTDNVWIHSTGNEWIPKELVPESDTAAPRTPVALSNLAGRDLRVYRNWDNYLGVFAADLAQSNLPQAFVGAYNDEANFGIVRLFSPQQTPGVKLFGWGPNFCCRDLFTDNRSEYFEIWGGIARTFFPQDDVTFQPGETRAWTEYLVPLPATNGLSAALPDFAMTLQRQDDGVRVTAYAAASRQGVLLLKQDEREIKRWPLALAATQRLDETLKLPAAPVRLELWDLDGALLLEATSP